MNENINLIDILKDHKGEIFYSLTLGDVIYEYPLNDGKRLSFYRIDDENNKKYVIVNLDGKSSTHGEIIVFPSKEVRDWNKWNKNCKKEYSWSEYCKMNGLNPDIDLLRNNNAILSYNAKSAIALYKILVLINNYYGGISTYNNSYTIIYNSYYKEFTVENSVYRVPINFSTKEYAEKFLYNEENVQLLKEYFII